MRFDVLDVSRYRVSALAMARGEHMVEEVAEGEILALVLVVGCIQVTRARQGQPSAFSLHARPGAPLFLINPGRYCAVAERNTLGVRGVRRG